MKKLLLLTILIIAAWSGWSHDSITQGATKDYTVQLKSGEAVGAKYSWVVTPAIGTSSDLTAITGNVATIVWDGPVGDYSVSVEVIDGNNCLSESISEDMEIMAPGDLFFAAALPSTITCSDLLGGEGSVPPSSESQFRINYGGDANLASANVTVRNPDGIYTDLDGTILGDQGNPEITIVNAEADKEIEFAVNDSWENAIAIDATFEIVLISALTSDNSNLAAVSTSDVERTITVLPKPVIEFQ